MTSHSSNVISASCPFLEHLHPTQLVRLLTIWGQKYDSYLNPIWLHNQGQNVIGFLPQTCFYLLPPTKHSEDSSNNLQILTLSRKTAPDFHSMITQVNPINQSDSLITKDIQIRLTNNQNSEAYVKQLIKYADKHTLSEHATDINDKKISKKEKKSSDILSNEYINGLMGYVGYDVMAKEIASSNQSSHRQTYLNNTQPAAYFAHYPLYLTCHIKHNLYHWQIHSTNRVSQTDLQSIQSWLKHVSKVIKPLIFKPLSLKMTARWSYDDYLRAFNKAQDYLHAGDCYQINLTQEWRGSLPNNTQLFEYLPKLHTFTNEPFAGYLHINSPKPISRNNSTQAKTSQTSVSVNFELLSCSPELFLTIDKSSKSGYQIHTKPIKGTRPRGEHQLEDNRLKNELANSEKDLAENVMIVDLLRNDLGKYAKIGSVKVPKRFVIESYSHVHHMVSTVTATLKDDIHSLQMLFGSLPAGSITGTPKKRAIEIINELEEKPRGSYCGTMGYMNFDGTGQWNVLIRTLQASQQTVSLWAGGGITVASDCQEEYQECFDKVGTILNLVEN